MKLISKLPFLVLFAVLSFSCSTDNIDENAEALSKSLIVPEAKSIEIEILELIGKHINEFYLSNLTTANKNKIEGLRQLCC